MTEDLITTFNISVVARGSISETGHKGDDGSRYAVPHKRGIFRCALYWAHDYQRSSADYHITPPRTHRQQPLWRCHVPQSPHLQVRPDRGSPTSRVL